MIAQLLALVALSACPVPQDYYEGREKAVVKVLVTAEWCPDCRGIEKRIKGPFLHLDLDKHRHFIRYCFPGIRQVPTLIVFRGQTGRFVSGERLIEKEEGP